MNIRGEKMVKINYQLTDEEKFEIYKSVKRKLQRGYYENRTEEQIAKAAEVAYNGEYTIEDDGVEQTPAEQIAELKKQLSATDYKVIKCSECQLLGEEMPYDVAELHAERQAIRDKINQLETA